MLNVDGMFQETSSPEQRLLSAVVAVAIRDAMQPPFKPLNSSQFRMRPDALTAFDFLMTDDCDAYLEWLDINHIQFRKRLFKMMDDMSTNAVPFSPDQRRAFRINRKLWQIMSDENGGGRVLDKNSRADEQDDA